MDPSVSDPDALLAAVERIGFLEWRLDQATLQLEAERAALGRERHLVAESSRREARAAERIRDLDRRLAEARADAARLGDRAAQAEKTRAEIERRNGQDQTGARITEAYQRLLASRTKDEVERDALAEARARIDRLERQQERFFERLVRWQHAAAREDRDAIDLAELIAELRNETLRLSAENTAVTKTNQVLRNTMADHAITAPEDVPAVIPEASTPRWLEAPAETAPRPAVDAADARHAIEAIADPIQRAHAGACFEAVLSVDAERAPAAVGALVRAAQEAAVPALVAAHDAAATHELRAACLHALGKLGGALAETTLIRAAGDEDWRIRAAAFESRFEGVTRARSNGTALRQPRTGEAGTGEAGTGEAALRLGLGDSDPRVRRRVVLAAASAVGFDPVAVLLEHVDDSDPRTRRAILTALGERGDTKALLLLTRALLDEDRTVRTGAARVLERRLGVTLRGVATATLPVRRKQAAAVREALTTQSITTVTTRGATWST